MKKIINLLILTLILLGVYFMANRAKAGVQPVVETTKLNNKKKTGGKEMKLVATIKTNKGEININLFPELSPKTVTNLVVLSQNKYYDGIKFHRVIADFMVQGGDPTGTGSGGPGYNFEDEVKNGLEFNKPGLLAMANAGPGTNGSQFFITHVETPWLTGNHTIYGEVVGAEDQKIVDLIQQGDIIETVTITGDTSSLLKENSDFAKMVESKIK